MINNWSSVNLMLRNTKGVKKISLLLSAVMVFSNVMSMITSLLSIEFEKNYKMELMESLLLKNY